VGNHRAAWSDWQEAELWRCNYFLPLSSIADSMGRTEDAILQRKRSTKTIPLEKRSDILTANQFAAAMGLCRSAARRLLKTERFGAVVYRRNKPVNAAMYDELKRWLANPLNWLNIDETKVEDPELIDIMNRALAKDRDRWLTIEQAADMAGYSYWGIHKMIREKRIPYTKGTRGSRGNALNLIKKSDIEALMEENRASF
jgi:hypothetical protein